MRMHRGMYMRHGVGWVIWQAISGLCAVAWRFATGAHMDGERRSDATWLAPATAPAAGRQLSWWTAMPRLKRAGIRLGVTVVVVMVLCGLVIAPTATQIALVIVAVAGLARGAWQAWQAWQERDWRRRYVLPIGMATGAMLGLSHGSAKDIEQWLTIPRDVFDETTRGELRLAISSRTAYDEKTLKSVEKLIAGKLAIAHADMEWAWHMVGEAPYLSARRRQSAPKRVELADIRHMITSEDDGVMPLGLGIARREIAPSLAIESPHIGFSCQTGSGKSETTKVMMATALHKGYDVNMIDVKIESQVWARGLPGVTYADEGKAAFELLLRLEREMKRRQQIVRDTPRGESADIGNRIILFFEEQNIGMAEIDAYWQTIKNEPEWKGQKNPAVRALFTLSCAGRSVKIHLVTIAQYFDVPSTCAGKPAIRQNYGIVIIRGTHSAWDMLAKHVKPYPRKPKDKQKGRMHILLDNEPVEFQSAIFTDSEALELATTGRGVTVPTQWEHESEHASSAVTGGSVTAVEGPRLYSLREAVDAGLVGDISYDNLRKLKSRDQNFPDGTTVGGRQKWEAEAIAEWYEARTLVESVTDSESQNDE